MRVSNVPSIAATESSLILQRIARGEKEAFEKCIETYGNLIWAMAQDYINPNEEAEIATQEIFQDIWQYAACHDSTKFDETAFVILIARRRLIKYLAKKLP